MRIVIEECSEEGLNDSVKLKVLVPKQLQGIFVEVEVDDWVIEFYPISDPIVERFDERKIGISTYPDSHTALVPLTVWNKYKDTFFEKIAKLNDMMLIDGKSRVKFAGPTVYTGWMGGFDEEDSYEQKKSVEESFKKKIKLEEEPQYIPAFYDFLSNLKESQDKDSQQDVKIVEIGLWRQSLQSDAKIGSTWQTIPINDGDKSFFVVEGFTKGGSPRVQEVHTDRIRSNDDPFNRTLTVKPNLKTLGAIGATKWSKKNGCYNFGGDPLYSCDFDQEFELKSCD